MLRVQWYGLKLMREENNLLGQIYNINPSRKVFVGVPEKDFLYSRRLRQKNTQKIFFKQNVYNL